MKNNECKYVISYGVKDNIVGVVVTVLFDIMAYVLYRLDIFAFIVFSIICFLITLMLLISIYCTLFHKIYIYDNYFVHRKSPFKDVIVNDYEVENAWIEQRNKLQTPVTVPYFFYVTKDGVKGKFAIPPRKYDYADYLVERLKGNDVHDYEEHIAAEYGVKKSDIPKDATLFEKVFIYSEKGAVITVAFVIIFFIVLFTLMTLNTGQKTPYTAEQVAEVMQSYGYDSIDNTEELKLENSSVEHSVKCTSAYPYIDFMFVEMDSVESAKSLFASLHNQFWDRHIFNTVIGESFYNNYTSKTYHLENDYYSEIVRVSNTVVIAQSKEDTKGKINELLTAMDYDQNTDNFKSKTN